MSFISVQNLKKTYAGTTVFSDINCEIAKGEFVTLLGPSGCGKSTLLRCIAGLTSVDGGKILLDGQDIVPLSPQKRAIGMVFQSYSLFPNMTARDNVAFGLRLRRQKGPQRRSRANELLELVGLAEHVSKYPHQLSGGQQQRVALARALAIEPRVLLLDEPLSALDAKVRAELRDQIRELQQRLSITTVFVTHDQEEALSMADRVCVMSRGTSEQIATPSELYSKPATPFVAEFVGVSSRVNVERTGDHVHLFGRDVKIRGEDFRLDLAVMDALLRPEDVDVEVSSDGLGVVVHRSFLGATTRLEIGIGGETVKADVMSSAADEFELGTRVRLSVNAPDVLVTEQRPVR